MAGIMTDNSSSGENGSEKRSESQKQSFLSFRINSKNELNGEMERLKVGVVTWAPPKESPFTCAFQAARE